MCVYYIPINCKGQLQGATKTLLSYYYVSGILLSTGIIYRRDVQKEEKFN